MILFQSFLVILILSVAGTYAQDANWGYDADEQAQWSNNYPMCSGRRQSPVFITSEAITPRVMPQIEMDGYENPIARPVSIRNTGRTVTLTIPEDEDDRPSISGGPLDAEYEMESVRFHWGSQDNYGSEHIIDDQEFAMEMHIIHRNKNYEDRLTARAAADGYANIAVFFKVEARSSQEVYKLTETLEEIRRYNTSSTLDFSLSLSELLNGLDMTRFYTYRGSVTSPPCSESVTWIVYPDALPISRNQMTLFRQLRTKDNIPLMDNLRHVQPLNGRTIYSRIARTTNK